MFSVENAVGRLIEVRLWAPAQRGEIDSLGEAMRRPLALHTPAVLCVDLREASVLDPASAAQVIERMRENDSRIERQAMLVPGDNAIVAMQVDRMLRQHGISNRQAFKSVVALADWLDPVLTPRERVRLLAFLTSSTLTHARAS